MRKGKSTAPSRAVRGLVLPDTHVPFHDPRAVDVTRQYLAANHWDFVVHVGDFLDLQSISRFVQTNLPAIVGGRLIDEFTTAREIAHSWIRAARQVNPACEVFFLEGNHEVRLKRFEALHPQLAGLFDLRRILGLGTGADELPATYIEQDSSGSVLRFEWSDIKPSGIVSRTRSPHQRHLDAGPGVTVVHGLSHSMHSAKMTADMMPWPGPCMFGHVHTRAAHTAKRWGLDKPYGITCGMLCLPVQEYTAGKPTQWDQGCGEFVMDPAVPGNCDAFALRIIDGRMIGLDGRIYSSEV